MDAVKFNSIPKQRAESSESQHAYASTLGVYVSVPFCRAKCSYCNFASGVFGKEKMATYVDRLVAEIRSVRSRAEQWGANLPQFVDSVYFGGGTPSLLQIIHLQDILKAINDTFPRAPKMEMTLECAPGQVEDELLDALPGLGFNRISLGVQSFVDRETKAVGRMHSLAVTLQDVLRLRSVGIENINVDLIAGLPHQTTESWRESVKLAIDSGVPHMSVYMLDVDEDSRLGREMLAGGTRYGVGLVPGDDRITEMYAEACERFAAAGIPQYEISNFARPGFESRHNLKYWTRQDYVGFGLDAHSCLRTSGGGHVRIARTDDLDEYLNRGAREAVTPVSGIDAIEESWFLGLRLYAGISLAEIEREIGSAAMAAFQPVLQQCIEEESLEYCDGNIRLTARGKLFANDVFARFLGVLGAAEREEQSEIAAEQWVFA